MFVWSTERIYWERYTDKATGEEKTIGMSCRCCLCGAAEHSTPLVRFDRIRLKERPENGYPRVGICGACIERALRAVDHCTAEAGMVRIGSPYRCTHCSKQVTPVVWFDTNAVQEQYICARCLIEAQKQILIEQEDLQEQKRHLR